MITLDLALFMNVPWLERRTKTLVQSAGQISESIGDENGNGDITLEGRYNFWRSTRWDKFASVLLGTTLPTGQFAGERSKTVDPLSKRKLITTGPALQLGKDTAIFTGGLLYSQRWKDIWMHTSALYTSNPANDDDFAFGDVSTPQAWLCTTRQIMTCWWVWKWTPAIPRKTRTAASKSATAAGTAVKSCPRRLFFRCGIAADHSLGVYPLWKKSCKTSWLLAITYGIQLLAQVNRMIK